jgi:hypothetical protein
MDGEIKSQGASEQLENFKKLVDDYISLKGVKRVTFSEDFHVANELDLDVIDRLNQQECFNYAYTLYQYANYIQDEANEQKVVLDWCNSKLNYIIANNQDNFPQFTKHEMKIPLMIKENSFACKIDNWKTVVQARLQVLEGKENIIKRKADCLMEKGKRK